jgi:protein-disulfide isomerase
MTESLPLATGSVFAQAFKILKPLGDKDGIASYLAEQAGAPGPRMLKTLSPDLVKDPAHRARFLDDLRSSARVTDAHVARVLDAGVDEASGLPWFAREALKGESLGSFAADRGTLSAAEVGELFDQLGRGLGAIHAAGLVHGDVRPETIFLQTMDQPGAPAQARLVDLGLAAFLGAVKGLSAAGDPLWMAPEQADARPPVGAAADVWAMGLLGFFLLTGKSYWKGASAGSMAPAVILREVLTDPIVPASMRAVELGAVGRLPDGFDAWFFRCVARFPADRFPSAREAADAVRAGWGGASRAPLPSFSLGPDSNARAPLPSFDLGPDPAPAPGGRAPLPSFDLEVGPPPGGPPGAPGGPPGAWGGGGPGWGGAPGGPPPGAPPGAAPWAPQFGPGPGGPPAPTWGAQPQAKSSSPLPWVIGILAVLGFLVIALIGGVFAFARYRQRSIEAAVAAESAASAASCPIPVTAADPSWGDRNALVTIVEFADFQCPFCKRSDTTLAALRSQYDTATLRIVWKNNPLSFHTRARPTALAAMSLFASGGNDAFWKFHDNAFANQDALTDENFELWTRLSGADVSAWQKAELDPAAGLKVDGDAALARDVGAKGTPAFFINGIHLAGAQPISRFTEVIDAQRTAARAAVAAGTRPEDVYAKLTTENRIKNPLPAEEKAAPTDETTVWLVPVGTSPARGSAAAPVTIVEFADFQCPFCARADKTLGEIRDRYGVKVRFVWKNNPLSFHVHAMPAAQLAVEVRSQKGDTAFWRLHDIFYENQTHLEDTDLIAYGKRVGLGQAGAARAVGRKDADAISADMRLAKALDASGTPTFFVNGRRLVGAQPLEKFSGMIDEELRHAETLAATGVAPESVYAEIMKTAKEGHGH